MPEPRRPSSSSLVRSSLGGASVGFQPLRDRPNISTSVPSMTADMTCVQKVPALGFFGVTGLSSAGSDGVCTASSAFTPSSSRGAGRSWTLESCRRCWSSRPSTSSASSPKR